MTCSSLFIALATPITNSPPNSHQNRGRLLFPLLCQANRRPPDKHPILSPQTLSPLLICSKKMVLCAHPRCLASFSLRRLINPNTSRVRAIPTSCPGFRAGFGRLDARLFKVMALEEEKSSAVAKEDDIEVKKNAGPSFYFGSAGEQHSSDDGGESLLPKINLKMDSDEASTVLIYGVGAMTALWISLAIVSALDSIPVLPKLMEVVGLGFTIWFTSRYLIYKNNRAELLEKLADLKKRVTGSIDD